MKPVKTFMLALWAGLLLALSGWFIWALLYAGLSQHAAH